MLLQQFAIEERNDVNALICRCYYHLIVVILNEHRIKNNFVNNSDIDLVKVNNFFQIAYLTIRMIVNKQVGTAVGQL